MFASLCTCGLEYFQVKDRKVKKKKNGTTIVNMLSIPMEILISLLFRSETHYTQ